MNPEDVKRYYQSQYNFRKKTGMSTSTLGNWLKWGYVPEDAQYKLERLTGGELKASEKEPNEAKENQNIYEAKKSIKYDIKFLESLLHHLNGNDPTMKTRALWTSWCLHRYMNEGLIVDIENAMRDNNNL